MALRCTPVSSARTVIVAPGTMAPDASVTRPLSVAMDCAYAAEASALSAAEATRDFQRNRADRSYAVDNMMSPFASRSPTRASCQLSPRFSTTDVAGVVAPLPLRAVAHYAATHP